MKISIALFALILCLSCQPKDNYMGVPVSEIEMQLHNLLNNYYPRIIDTINGGYWTNLENDWTLSENQNKMLVTQARGLWTAARAAELFPDNPVFRKAADHGFRFLTAQMWDTVNGGFFQHYYIDSAQKTDATFKLTYGNAFALYGLSQYARINKDPEAIDWVRKSFDWLEKELHDSVYRGYYNIFVPANVNVDYDKAVNKAGWGQDNWKDQNTSIHLMEAFTVAYQVLQEEPIKARLIEMLELVRDSMTNDDGTLDLYFTKTWQPISHRDSSREYIIRNPALDHISFGHNIETAYLLADASQALYGEPDSLTLTIAKKLLDHTLSHGFDRDNTGLFDKGYNFSGDEVEVIDSTKVWWAQAEAWHALALFSVFYPEEQAYPEAFKNMWTYITNSIVDPENGGWYNSGTDRNPETINNRKAHAWKGCYHDGRALMQVYDYISKE